jgi:hypothetical protein
MGKEYKYDVCLSFAGENRVYVEQVAQFLTKKGVKVFYDQFEEVNTWGKDLVEHFDGIYRKETRYCVMFISDSYAQKAWPSHEKQSALARALGERGYILPVRFDDTDIPGLPPTIGYIDLRKYRPEELGELIIKKLGKETLIGSKEQVQQALQYRKPKVTKVFDPYKESQLWIDCLVKELHKRCDESGVSFTSMSRDGKECLRFVVNGSAIYSINVKLGGLYQDHGLSFSYAHGEMSPLSSGINAFGNLEWDKEKECIVLKLNDFSVFSSRSDLNSLTQLEFINFIWEKVCDVIDKIKG